MKKIFSVFLLLSVLFVFSACTAGEGGFYFETRKDFSCHMTSTYKGKTFEADISCAGESISTAFSSPSELQMLSVESMGSEYRVKIGGREDILQKNQISSSAYIKFLLEGIKLSLYKNGADFIKDGENFYAEINANGFPARAVFCKDGFLRSLKSESMGFSAEFYY